VSAGDAGDAGAAAVERRLFEVLGGWVPTVEDPEAKLLLRVHSFQHAWHAGLFGGLGRSVGPAVWANGEASGGARLAGVAAAVDAMATLDGTVVRLVAAYRVVLPYLVETYRDVTAAASPADGPLRRVLSLVLADDETGWREGERLVQRVVGDVGVDDMQSAVSAQARIEQVLRREATAGSRIA
jgi:hypothetical protein